MAFTHFVLIQCPALNQENTIIFLCDLLVFKNKFDNFKSGLNSKSEFSCPFLHFSCKPMNHRLKIIW